MQQVIDGTQTEQAKMTKTIGLSGTAGVHSQYQV